MTHNLLQLKQNIIGHLFKFGNQTENFKDHMFILSAASQNIKGCYFFINRMMENYSFLLEFHNNTLAFNPLMTGLVHSKLDTKHIHVKISLLSKTKQNIIIADKGLQRNLLSKNSNIHMIPFSIKII